MARSRDELPLPAAILGGDGDPCAGCGAALASDQRYCLECGRARAAPRVDYRTLLRPAVLPWAAPALSSAPFAGDDSADLAAAAPDDALAPGMPGPRAAALALMSLLMAGVVLGAAFGPPAADSLAAATRYVVMNPTAPAEPAPEDATASADEAVDPGADAGVADEVVSDAALEGGSETASAAALSFEEDVPLDEAPADETTDPGDSGTAPAAEKATIGHVFVLVLAGRGYETTFGATAPRGYLRDELPRRGQLLTGYHAVARGGLSNRIALISGQAPNPQTLEDCPTYSEFTPGTPAPDGQFVGTGCLYPAETKTVADQTSSLGLTWRGYFEDMAAPCQRPQPGAPDPTRGAAFTTAANPFAYFHSLVDPPECNRNTLPLTRLAGDLGAARTTANYTWIAPNRCNAGYDGACPPGATTGPAATDAFLRTWVPAIERSPAYKQDGLLAIVFDEARPAPGAPRDAAACCGQRPGPNTTEVGGGRVGALLFSPYVRPGSRNATPYNHYGLLRSVETLLGLEPLGFAKRAGVRAFGNDVFKTPVAPLPVPGG